jgi:hypothetical protein
MSKRKDRRSAALLFENLSRAAAPVELRREARDESDETDDADDGVSSGHADAPVSDETLAASRELSCLVTPPGAQRPLPKMRKFRFQLLHEWLVGRQAPCRVADVGGGKGLLAYLLQRSGWEATVVDPISQDLPAKYKDLATGRQVRIAETERVPRRDTEFTPEMAADFDLLVAMHAHGCNILLLDAAARYGRSVVLLPCCIIHEPVIPPPGVHWLQCVVNEATARGLTVEPFRLNFKGQNIGLLVRPA